MDIPDIRRVVQFMVPNSMNDWAQHAGRAGRDGKHAISVLLVEKSVFEKKKKSKKSKVKKTVRNSELKIKREDTPPASVWDLHPHQSQACADQEHNHADPFNSHQLINDDAINNEDAADDLAMEEDDNLEYRKHIDDPLREMIEADCGDACRRQSADIYYRNPPRPTGAHTMI